MLLTNDSLIKQNIKASNLVDTWLVCPSHNCRKRYCFFELTTCTLEYKTKVPNVHLHIQEMAASTIPLDKAYLTAIWLETLFYGIHLQEPFPSTQT